MYIDMKSPDNIRIGLHVYLDGMEQSYCTRIDTNKGLVERFKTNDDGSIIVNNDGWAVLEMLKGYVTIEYKI